MAGPRGSHYFAGTAISVLVDLRHLFSINLPIFGQFLRKRLALFCANLALFVVDEVAVKIKLLVVSLELQLAEISSWDDSGVSEVCHH